MARPEMRADDPRNNVGRGIVDISGAISNYKPIKMAPITAPVRENEPWTVPDPQGGRRSNVLAAITDRIGNFFGFHNTPETAAAPAAPAPTAARNIAIAGPGTKPAPITAIDHNGNSLAMGTKVTLPGQPARRNVAARKIAGTAQPTSATAEATATEQTSTPAASPRTIAGPVTGMSMDELNSSITSYEPEPGGGIATNGDNIVVMRGRTPTEQVKFQEQQQAAQPIAGITTPPAVDMSPGSQGEWERNQGIANSLETFTDPNLKKVDPSVALGQALNRAVKYNTIATGNAGITHLSNQDAMAAQELPSKIGKNIAETRHANTASDIAGLKAPAEIANIKAITAQHDALTETENYLREARKNNIISEVESRKGLLDIAGKKLELLTKQLDLRIAAAKSSKTEPDYKLIFEVAKSKLKTYQEMAALGASLTPEQTLDIKKQNDILNLVQRSATKTKTVQGGTGITGMDEEA